MRLFHWLVLFPIAAPAATPVDPADLVRRTAERYERAVAYHFRGTTVLESLGVVYQFTREQAGSPDGRQFLFMNSPRREMGFANDGETTWAWLPRVKQYAAVRTAELEAPGAHWAYGSPARVRAELTVLLDTRYGKLEERAATATYEGREKVKTPQGKVDCYVIELGPGLQPGRLTQPPPGYTGPSVRQLWIGMEDGLIWKDLERKPIELRSDRMVTVSTSWDIMEVDQPVATSLFRFKPSGDVKQVAALDLPPPPIDGPAGCDGSRIRPAGGGRRRKPVVGVAARQGGAGRFLDHLVPALPV